MFKKMLASIGVGSASIETVLHNTQVRPGGTIQGVVHLKGGEVDQKINSISVALMARVETESGDQEFHQNVVFTKLPLSGEFELDDDDQHDIPFTLDVPWETPITAIARQKLRGMAIGVSTHLDIAKGKDEGDLDPVQILPLPAQELILDALALLGFRFKRADLERGHIHGSRQTLPFYQEIEFAPGPRYRGINELEVTFIAGPQQIEVVFEADKRRFGGSTDMLDKIVVDHATASQRNWEQALDQMMQKFSGHRGWF